MKRKDLYKINHVIAKNERKADLISNLMAWGLIIIVMIVLITIVLKLKTLAGA